MTEKLQLPSLILKFLEGRGFKSQEEILKYIQPSLKELTDPLKLDGMGIALRRLKHAWEHQEKVCVYGDYDLDGSSGIALLVRGLEGLGFENINFYQPSRFIEGYGIHKEALKIIKDRGDQVVISVDCGITATEEANYAKEIGLDLIITDHHLPLNTLPECVAVINPNKGFCFSELGHLSGVGVGFYLIMALKRELKVEFDLKSLLDFFTIGTVTDMVPLVGENRVLVKHGLKILAQTHRPGLKALLKILKLHGRDLDTQDVSFSIGPKLNALSRLEKGLRPLDIFMCQNDSEAQILVEQVMKLNEERKSLQKILQQKIMDQLHHEEMLKPAIVLSAEGHAGVVGLVATKIAQLSNKPTFIVAWHHGEGIGSARGVERDLLPQALDFAGNFLERYGGHSQAAGFSITAENFEKFKEKILEHYSNALRVEDKAAAKKEVKYDMELKVSDLNENVMNWLTQLGPYGNNNPQPLFKLTGFEIANVKWMKDEHLKLQFTDGKAKLEGVAFFAKETLRDSVADVAVGNHEKLGFLVEPSWNHFNGSKRVQLLIRDITIN